MKNNQNITDAFNNPVAWFLMLERAKQLHNFELAAKALRELERLGVIVKYRKPILMRERMQG
ncbi:MAG: hypothetical protein JW749_03615 [Sedimentisphaerales bacterium]|nr:hypothetical protein [Sedimentisphaerales bacterium]